MMASTPQHPSTPAAASPEAPRPGEGVTPPQPGTASAATEVEIGGPDGPEPTRYGDWERKGRCIDF
jgi:hypothetical protein